MDDTTKTTTETGERRLQDELRESAHKIWLAGLGALAAAEEEGGKLFSRLVERGRDMESKGKENVKEGAEKVREGAEKVRERAGSALGDAGRAVDDALTSALHRFGVPTREEIQTLTQRVEELNAKVEQLRPKPTPTIVTPAEAATPGGGTGPVETPETPEKVTF